MEIEKDAQKRDLIFIEKMRQFSYPAQWLIHNSGKGNRVLHLGCRSGELSIQLQKNNSQFVGVDRHTNVLKLAQKKGISVWRWDLKSALPFESQSFDRVIIDEFLNRVYDTRYVLKEAVRVLNNKGQLLVVSKNLNSLKNRIRVFRGDFPTEMGLSPDDQFGDHLRLVNLGKLKNLLNTVGLKVVEQSGAIDAPWLSTVQKWIGPHVATFSEYLLVRAQKISH